MKNDNKIFYSNKNTENTTTSHSPEKNTDFIDNAIEEEYNLTEADSRINYSIKANKSNNKKGKGFSSLVNRAVQKDFFFGGDYSDLFNIKDDNKPDSKKSKTVKILKKNKISNEIMDFLDYSDTGSEEGSKKF
jgi:hypothetical protein